MWLLVKNIAVVGAGIGGLCCALALNKQGFSVTVYEQAATISEVGAGLQLSPNAMHVLDQVGLTESLCNVAFRPQSAVMRHFKSGKKYFSIPLDKACLAQFGAEYWHVHRGDLQKVLYQHCIENHISVKLNSPVRTYLHNEDNSGVQLVLDCGEKISYDLIIGADGIHSKVQSTLLANLGLASEPKFTGQVAWRGTVKSADLPPKLVEPNANLWVGPGKHFVSYYVRGGELVNFVAVEERSDWQQESWRQEGDVKQLRQLFDGWHPQVTEVLAAAKTTFLWALHDREPLTNWVDNKVTLLGDACHPMLPFLAQGAAMAIEDAYVLATMIKKHANSQFALEQYQLLRLARTRTIQLKARKNASLYHMNNGLERTKLKVLAAFSATGISSFMANKQLRSIYAYDAVQACKE